MKHVIPFFIISTIVAFTAIVLLLIFNTNYNSNDEDVTILYNELINCVNQNQEEGSSFNVYYCVVYYNGELKYSNYNHQEFGSFDEYLNHAYKTDQIILDFSSGKIFVENVNKNIFNQLFYIILMYFLTIILLIILFLIYLNKKIFIPFKNLKSFASSIATGDLDMPMFMDKDNAFGAFTESFDIMRHELKKSREREVTLEKMKNELVLSLSHDIKTPIASIKAVSELLLLNEEDPKKMKNLEIIKHKTNDIDTLITNMFNVTLEDISEFKINMSIVSSKEIINMIVETDVYELISEINIPECLLRIDKLRLKQIFGNIISNSYKYANTEIKIYSHINHDTIELEFIDYGDGVKEEELLLLTNKFYRGLNTENQSGAGLGLYICKVLLEKMDGMIECYNNSNGFSVKITLKLA